MWKNYFKTAIRSLLKNKAYSMMNILGLSIALACSAVIMLYIKHEVSYDKFYPEGDRVYRMALERIYPAHVNTYALIPSGFAEAVSNDIHEVEGASRIIGQANFRQVVKYLDKTFEEAFIFIADSNFVELLGLEMVKGNPKTVLKNAGNAVITESIAKKYFGDSDPIGENMEIDGNPIEVSGVMRDIPGNSHFQFDFLVSGTGIQFLQNPNYLGFSSYTYLKLAEGADPGNVEAKFPALVEKYASGQIERQLGVSYDEYMKAGNGYRYFLQPIGDIHLHSKLGAEIKPTGSILYVYLFLAIAVFILIIAAVNFVNLATARSTERAKEVGMRKVMGSSKGNLIIQFLTESVLVALLAYGLAMLLVQVFVPFFNNLAQQQLAFNLSDIGLMTFFAAIAILTGLLAGIYPAFYISALEPSVVMKGAFKTSSKGLWVRNGLVMFQFFISIVLIAGTLVVYKQMHFVQTKQLGFEKENVLVIDRANVINDQELFRVRLLDLPEVGDAAVSSALPGGFHFGVQFQIPGEQDILTTKGIVGDDHFLQTMGIKVIAGRGFSEDFNDSLSVILNKTAVTVLGLEDPIGAKLKRTDNGNNQPDFVEFTVIGVTEDYHFESLHQAVTSLAIFSTEGQNFAQNISLRLSTVDMPHTLDKIKSVWAEFAPDQPFIYSFLDSELDALYRGEKVSANLLGLFAIIAVIIACVGLFGLVAYTINQRKKEIGVRKVLGSSVVNVVMLLTKDFAKLIAVAFAIAAPVAWMLMNSWLENFAYRINVEISLLVGAGLLAAVIAMLTIGYLSVKAALTNPVNSLKSE